MVAGVGQHVRVASSSPPTLSVRHGENLRAVTVEVAAQLVIAESHDEVRAGVVVQGDGGSGLELEFGDAYAVFHKKNFPGAAVEDVEAAVVLRMGGVPVDRGLPKFVVLDKLDGDVAERLEGNISEMWAKVARTKRTSPSESVRLTRSFPFPASTISAAPTTT
jgi:hypothetical protein